MFDNLSQSQIIKYSILAVALVAILVIIHIFFLQPKPIVLSEQHLPKIGIDWDVLGGEDLQKLIPFNRISFPEKVGRSNPFIEY